MFEEKIEQGVHLLDARKPGWYHHVDLAALDLNNCGRCVLGQLFIDYTDGIDRLMHETGERGDSWSWGDERGFCVNKASELPDNEGDELYATLTAEWIMKIQQIRTERKHGVRASS